ncbi:hypothetical protein Taro_025628 [Colocasia esculenta]|uniref:Uncharacterized protein n=1 Tax=Colocasia esculenta TaxID=4460 RepID=A0A843V9C6_COLES|nr:hypothetical protein [Colocasia esculenta]
MRKKNFGVLGKDGYGVRGTDGYGVREKDGFVRERTGVSANGRVRRFLSELLESHVYSHQKHIQTRHICDYIDIFSGRVSIWAEIPLRNTFI